MLSRSLIASTVLAAVFGLAACGEEHHGAADHQDADATAAEAAQPEAADVADAAETVAVDAELYAGLYGDAANPEEMRGMYFVLPAAPPPMADRFPDLPDGAIMIGAMWADVANWYLLPVSETRFEQTLVSDFQDAPMVAEFQLNEDGDPVSVTFSGLNDEFGVRTRVGDVPEEWR